MTVGDVISPRRPTRPGPGTHTVENALHAGARECLRLRAQPAPTQPEAGPPGRCGVATTWREGPGHARGAAGTLPTSSAAELTETRRGALVSGTGRVL